MKQKIFFIIPIVLMTIFPVANAASLSVSNSLPGIPANVTDPGAWINGFYTLALMFGGVLAFGAVVYGGVLYAASAGNPSRQSEGKEWIWAALTGLLLLAGAWLVLTTINPTLTNVSFPTLSALPAATAGGTGNGGGRGAGGGGGAPTNGGLTQDQAKTALDNASIGVVSTGNCSDPNNSTCTSLVGMQQSTINELVGLKSACGCTVTVSGGTETGHSAGDQGHSSGYKADIQLNDQVSTYIQSHYDQQANRSSDGAPQWKDPTTGAIYALEASKNHWDITTAPGH